MKRLVYLFVLWMLVPRLALANGAWTVAAWYVDNGNSSGNASDTNSCQDSGHPCATFAQVVARLGTLEPYLGQSTTFSFLSSDTAELVNLRPFVTSNSATITFLGVPTTTTTSVTALTSLNRSTGTFWTPTFANAITAGAYLDDTTAGAVSWAYSNVAGNQWVTTQPITNNLPFTTQTPAEVNWGNGDSVSVLALPTVQIGEIRRQETQFNTNPLVVQRIQIGGGLQSRFSGGVVVQESRISQTVVFEGCTARFQGLFNDDIEAEVVAANACPGTVLYINAGGQRQPGSNPILGQNIQVDGDFVANNFNTSGQGVYGNVGLFSGATWTVQNGRTTTSTAYGGPFVYTSSGTLNVAAGAHLVYPAGAGKAAATFLGATLQIGGQTVACNGTGSNFLSGAGTVNASANCNITLTAAHLDAALGAAGFGGGAASGGAWRPEQEASITNF